MCRWWGLGVKGCKKQKCSWGQWSSLWICWIFLTARWQLCKIFSKRWHFIDSLYVLFKKKEKKNTLLKSEQLFDKNLKHRRAWMYLLKGKQIGCTMQPLLEFPRYHQSYILKARWAGLQCSMLPNFFNSLQLHQQS